jgi:magnesium chelatase family protein
LSGPVLDRFDLRVEVGRPDVAELLDNAAGEPTRAVAARVARARAAAARRDVVANTALPAWRLDDVAALDRTATRLIERALRAGRLTGRGLGGVRRVARTIADLAGHAGPLGVEDVSTALALRADPLCFDWRVA